MAWIAVVHLRSTALYNDFQADSTDLFLIEPSIPKVLGIYNIILEWKVQSEN